MVVLGIDVYKDTLKEIAEKSNMMAEDTPASNVIRIKFDGGSFTRFVQTAYKIGYNVSYGQLGQLLVKKEVR